MNRITQEARQNLLRSMAGVDDIEFDGNNFTFEFDFGLDGLEKVEERIESRMNAIISEELEKFCFDCQDDKLYDEERNTYYCPESDE